MALARIRELQKYLVKKYGVIGAVAGRYVEAGLHVQLMHPTRYGPAHVIATGAGQRVVVEVVYGVDKVGPEVVETLLKKAELLRAKPVLVLYGAGPRLTDEARALVEERGVKVRRLRPPVLPTDALPREKSA